MCVCVFISGSWRSVGFMLAGVLFYLRALSFFFFFFFWGWIGSVKGSNPRRLRVCVYVCIKKKNVLCLMTIFLLLIFARRTEDD